MSLLLVLLCLSTLSVTFSAFTHLASSRSFSFVCGGVVRFPGFVGLHKFIMSSRIPGPALPNLGSSRRGRRRTRSSSAAPESPDVGTANGTEENARQHDQVLVSSPLSSPSAPPRLAGPGSVPMPFAPSSTLPRSPQVALALPGVGQGGGTPNTSGQALSALPLSTPTHPTSSGDAAVRMSLPQGLLVSPTLSVSESVASNVDVVEHFVPVFSPQAQADPIEADSHQEEAHAPHREGPEDRPHAGHREVPLVTTGNGEIPLVPVSGGGISLATAPELSVSVGHGDISLVPVSAPSVSVAAVGRPSSAPPVVSHSVPPLPATLADRTHQGSPLQSAPGVEDRRNGDREGHGGPKPQAPVGEGGGGAGTVPARRVGSVSGRSSPPLTRFRNPAAAPLRPPAARASQVDMTPFLATYLSDLTSDSDQEGPAPRGLNRHRLVPFLPVTAVATAPHMPVPPVFPSAVRPVSAPAPTNAVVRTAPNDPPRPLDPPRIASRAASRRQQARVHFELTGDGSVVARQPHGPSLSAKFVVCPVTGCGFSCSYGDPASLGAHLEAHVASALSARESLLADECIRFLTALRSSGGEDCSPFPLCDPPARPSQPPPSPALAHAFPPVAAGFPVAPAVVAGPGSSGLSLGDFVQSLQALLVSPTLVAAVDLSAVFDQFLRGFPVHDPVWGYVAATRQELLSSPPSARVAMLSRLVGALAPLAAQERAQLPPHSSGVAWGRPGTAAAPRDVTTPHFPPPTHPFASPASADQVCGSVGWTVTPSSSRATTNPPGWHPSFHGASAPAWPSPAVSAGIPFAGLPAGMAAASGGWWPSAPSPYAGMGQGLPSCHDPHALRHSLPLSPNVANCMPLWGTTVGGVWMAESPHAAAALLPRWLAKCGRLVHVKLPDQSTVTEAVHLGESIAPFRAAKRGFEGTDYDFILSAALANAPLTCFDASLVSRWKKGVSVVSPKDVGTAEGLALLHVPHLSAFAPPNGSLSVAIGDSGELVRAVQGLHRALQHLFGIGNPIDPDMARLTRLVDVDWRADGVPPNHIALIVEHGWARWRQAARDFCAPRLDSSTARISLCVDGRLDPGFPSLFEYVRQSRFQVATSGARRLEARQHSVPAAPLGSAAGQLRASPPSSSVGTKLGKTAVSTDQQSRSQLRQVLGAVGRIKVDGKLMCVKFLQGKCSDSTCPRYHGK